MEEVIKNFVLNVLKIIHFLIIANNVFQIAKNKLETAENATHIGKL